MRNLKHSLLAAAVALVLTGTVARAQVVVTASAGQMGPTMYPTLSAAFADINAGLPQGIIGVGIMSNITETGPCVLNASGAGAAIYTSVTIAPIVDNVTISGPTVAGRGLIELNGADNIIIDGDNPNTAGVNRNLTILNTAANTVARTSCIRLATSTLITNCDNVTIRNLNLTGSATGRNISSVITEVITWGVIASTGASTSSVTTAPSALASGTATLATGQTMTSLQILNNNIQNVSRGVSINGGAVSTMPNLLIANNTIGNPVAGAADQVWGIGITAQGSTNGVISGNIVYLEGYIESSTPNKAIDIGTISANGTFTIERNEIRRVTNNDVLTYPAVGINIAGGTGHLIRNNFITGISNSMVSGTGGFSETWGMYAIRLFGGTGHQVIYNTVHLSSNVPGTTSDNVSACLLIGSTSISGCNVSNNVFSNQMTGGNPAGQNTRFTCLLLPSGASSSMNLTLNNNRYYQGGSTSSSIAQVGFYSTATTDYLAANFNAASTTPVTNLRAYTSTLSTAGTNDNASGASTLPPPLVSSTNLHANLSASNVTDLNGMAVVIAGTTTDFDNDTRDATTPDIGADEFILGSCVSASGGTVSPSSVSTCAGQSITMTSTGATTGTGITYQWMVGPTSGGPYTNVVGGSGATTISYTTAALSAGTYYYVLQTTCSFGPSTGLSNQVTVTVNALPNITVTPSSATYCSGGPGLALSASGGVTYAWTPSTGLSATTGANVTATPSASIVYTVTGVSASGCFNSATASVAVSASPTVTATATPSVICTGGNSQLQATVGGGSEYYTIAVPYAPTTGVGTAAVTGDDANSSAITIPFPFTFYGTSYTQLFVNTNGYVQLGSTAGPTNVYGQLLPAAATPNNMIAGVFSDLNSVTAGQIVTYTTGSSPNRIFTIYYNNVPFYSSAASPYTTGNTNFQIQLFETSNIVEVHVGNVTGQSTTTANKTLGIENAAGTSAVTPMDRNFTNWVSASPQAWRFVPNNNTYGWTPATFLTSTTIANPVAQNATASNTYSVTVTQTSGCTGSASASLTVGLPLLTSATISPAATVCAGTTVTLNGGASDGGQPYSFSWTGPNSFTSTLQSPTLVTTTAATGTYILTVTDACGATSVSTVALTVNALPAVTVSPTSGVYCTGSPAVTLTANGASSYNWAPSTGLSATTGSTVNASPSMNITYTVIGTGANGCTASATTAIASSAPLTGVTASASAASICPGGSVNLTSSVNTTVTPLSQDFTTLGGWTVTNAPSSPAACAWMSQAQPFTWIAGSLNFSNFTTTNGGNFFMSNSDAGGSGSTTNTQLVSPVFSTVGMTSATLTFEHVYQRWASGDVTVAVEISTDGGNTWAVLQAYTSNQGNVTNAAQSTTNASINLSGYLNQSNLRLRYNYVAVWGYYWIIDNVVVSGSTTPTFAWTSSPTGFTSTLQNPMNVMPSVTTDYIVTISNPLGCAANSTVSVVVHPLPPVTANATSTAVCQNSSVTLTGSGATSYTWSNSVVDGVPFTPATTNTYTVTGTDANGCQNTDAITVTVNALPAVGANTSASAVCMNDQVTLTGNGANTYTWSNSVVDGVPFAPASTNTYTVTGTDGNGCQNTAMVTVTVNALPNVTATSTSAAVCAGDSVAVMGGGANSYAWSGGVMDGVPFVLSTTTTYTVTGTDANGCQNMASVSITANVPNGSLSLPMDTVCQNMGTITLTGGSPAGGMWGGPGVTGNVFDPMASGTGPITITYVFTDANGCSGTATDVVFVDICMGIPSSVASTGVNIYPNPTLGQFTIQLSAVPSAPVQVELTNELGQVIDAFTMTSTTKDMDITNLEGGVYFVRVINGNDVNVYRVVRQ